MTIQKSQWASAVVALMLAALLSPSALRASGSRGSPPQAPSQVATISGINPATVTVGDPAFTLSVTGTNFISGTTAADSSVLQWNGADRPTTIISSTLLTALIPAADITNVIPVTLAVFNPGPGGGLSTGVPFTISQASAVVAVSTSANPSVFGQLVSFSAGVTTSQTLTPSGIVSFSIDATAVGALALVNGSATFMTNTLGVGSHSVLVTYSGDNNVSASSATLAPNQLVNPAPSSTSLSAQTPNPSTFGQAVSFTASVSSVYGQPTGSVSFSDGSTPLGTSSMDSNGNATLTTAVLAAGVHTLTASYTGDGNFAASASAGMTHTVTRADAAVALATSQTTLVYGAPLVLTASVTSSAAVPTGTVNFLDGASLLGSASLTSGTAVLSTALSAGSHMLRAQLVNSNFQSASSPGAALTVNKNLSLKLTLTPTDDGAGEVQQGEIVAGLLLPADQQTAKTIYP